jgi:EmrB/QacA subfamily drug resistance transporter
MDTEAVHERRWIALGVLCLSLLVVGLDNTILSVAIPKLSEELSASTSQIQWIVDGYTLVFAGLLLTTGSLGDRFGRRSALSIGLVIFVIFSALSAFATSPAFLIATRSAMGVGGALIMPATLSLLTNIFTDPKERARAIGVWAGVSGIGVAIGPMLGGWLLEHFSWGSVFLVNVPVVAIALPAGYFLLPNSRAEKSLKLDPVGAVLSIIGLVSLVFAIIEGPEKGWGSPLTLGAFAVGIVGMAAFIAWEMSTEEPMLDVRFFKNPRFSAANIAITLAFFAMVGSMFIVTQFMQFVLGYTPLQAGIRSLPMALMLMIVAPQSSKLVEKVGTKIVVAAGLFVVALGLATAATATIQAGYVGRVLPSQLLLGLGIALAMAPATESVMGSLPREKAGVGSAMNDTTRQVGGAVGVAVIGSVFSMRYGPAITSSFKDLGIGGEALAHSKESIGSALAVASKGVELKALTPTQGAQIVDAAREAFTHSMGRGLFVGALFALAGSIVALVFLPARAVDPTLAADGDVVDLDGDDLGQVAAANDLLGGTAAATLQQEALDEVADTPTSADRDPDPDPGAGPVLEPIS